MCATPCQRTRRCSQYMRPSRRCAAAPPPLTWVSALAAPHAPTWPTQDDFKEAAREISHKILGKDPKRTTWDSKMQDKIRKYVDGLFSKEFIYSKKSSSASNKG